MKKKNFVHANMENMLVLEGGKPSKGKVSDIVLCFCPEGPHFAAVNKNNEIIITDFHNHSVKVLNPFDLFPPSLEKKNTTINQMMFMQTD